MRVPCGAALGDCSETLALAWGGGALYILSAYLLLLHPRRLSATQPHLYLRHCEDRQKSLVSNTCHVQYSVTWGLCSPCGNPGSSALKWKSTSILESISGVNTCKNSTEIDSLQARDTVSVFFFFFFLFLFFSWLFLGICVKDDIPCLKESDKIASLWALSGELARRAQLNGLFSGPDAFPVCLPLGSPPGMWARSCVPTLGLPAGTGCQAKDTSTPLPPWGASVQILRDPSALADHMEIQIPADCGISWRD